MIIPVRCFTCGKVIGHMWEDYKKRADAGENPATIMDSLGIKRYCCRTVFLTHSDNIKELAKFKV
ncbi:MAG: DNA-directed RNA polymerase subunit N [Candidatus Aenigmatarchaeota archaeon]